MMKTVLITGANSGLGFETAKSLAKNADCHLILACRNLEKAAVACKKIMATTNNQAIDIMLLDTSSLASVRNLVRDLTDKGQTIDVLINNAGMSGMAPAGQSEGGYEIVFATNYLGHFLLSNLLTPLYGQKAKIINVTSDLHNPPGGLTWPGIDIVAHQKGADNSRYYYSKLCMIYLSHGLVKSLAKERPDIGVASFNPGFMADTDFSNGRAKAREDYVKQIMPDRYSTLEQSYHALSHLVLESDLTEDNGAYYDRSTQTVHSSALSYDDGIENEVWEASLDFCKIK